MAMIQAKETGSMSYQVPTLTSTNYPIWAIKVKSILDAHGLLETIEPRALGEDPDSKKSKQALAFLFQAIPEEMVLQMSSYTDPKKVWDGLKTRYLGVDRVRAARIATLRRELEGLRLKEGELVDDGASKLEGLRYMKNDEKALVKKEEEQGQLLMAEQKYGESSGRGRGRRRGYGRRERGRGRGTGRGGDKSRFWSFNCGAFGHFGYECTKWKDEEKEANLTKEEEPTLL
ncbi:uncharacterized protein LOC110899085 [Helianthus annuus]|uniref:uncharacterized protein LOC110899085 n=1 Tax=Helianthus annuus TaxID=4232 RepID=UPI000B8FBBDD|nr:uncharacterized protein LOC110899085 [Helianthus annuus]